MKEGTWRGLMAGVVAIMAMVCSNTVLAELEWTLKKSRDGIQAFTARIENNDHLAFKGETVVADKTIDDVLAVMRDVPNMDKWLHTCYDPEILQDEDSLTRIIHMKNHTPTFLVAERDLILRQSITRSSPTTAEITLTGLPEQMPVQKSFVRIPYFDGRWEFEQTSAGLRIVYSGVIDPGGGLPVSITNMMVVDTPFETLKKLVAFMSRS